LLYKRAYTELSFETQNKVLAGLSEYDTEIYQIVSYCVPAGSHLVLATSKYAIRLSLLNDFVKFGVPRPKNTNLPDLNRPIFTSKIEKGNEIFEDLVFLMIFTINFEFMIFYDKLQIL
jgi:hypothetical protein